jgi:hypothetical protein
MKPLIAVLMLALVAIGCQKSKPTQAAKLPPGDKVCFGKMVDTGKTGAYGVSIVDWHSWCADLHIGMTQEQVLTAIQGEDTPRVLCARITDAEGLTENCRYSGETLDRFLSRDGARPVGLDFHNGILTKISQ